MPTFTYRARKLTGEPADGTLVADDEKAALAVLDGMGLFPIEVKDGSRSKTGTFTATANVGANANGGAKAVAPSADDIGRPNAADITRMMRQLADLLRAGVPLIGALEVIEKGGRGEDDAIWDKEGKGALRVAALITDVRREVSSGSSLADALGQHPDCFASTMVGVVRAGEAGGFLDEALQRVAAFAEREQALKRRVRAALIYPALLATVGTASVIFLIAWVVPRFTSMYTDMGGDLPIPTQILVAISDGIRDYWYLILGAAGLVAAGIWQTFQTEKGRTAVDALLLRIPLLRGVIGRAALSRFTSTLGMLLKSGVPILGALEIARDACGNRVFAAAVADTMPRVREGQDLAKPLGATRLFPATAITTISVGQESGLLADALIDLGERADEEIDHALRLFLGILEPALIVSMAGVVFFIVLAALLPVFTLNSMIK